MSRFVIDGFSAGGGCTRVDFCGSEGGAALPFPLRLSVLGTAIPFCLTGYDSGDPTMDDVCEASAEACDRSAMRDSLGALTVAITFEGWCCARHRSCAECKEVAAKAVRAMPVLCVNLCSPNGNRDGELRVEVTRSRR